MYITQNPKSKAEAKRWLAAGKRLTIHQPGPFGGQEPTDGWVSGIEGPHYPEPHRWYGSVLMQEGRIIKIK